MGSVGRSSGISLGNGGGAAFFMGCFPDGRDSREDSFSATAGCTGGGGKYPLFVEFVLGLRKPELTYGDSPLALSPLLLGGVLKGDRSTASDVASGARFARAAVSTECDFGAILGFPARFTGGGTGGADAVGRSLFCGSLVRLEPLEDSRAA